MDVQIENPILRARRALKLSQSRLARELGVTEQTIRRAEQGTFNQLPPSIINLDKRLDDAGLIDLANVESDYEDWRIKLRLGLRVLVPSTMMLHLMHETAVDVGKHPFSLFRTGMLHGAKQNGWVSETVKKESIAGFAKLVAISPDSIHEFEAGTGVGLLGGGHAAIKNLLADLGIQRANFGLFVGVR